ncbi:MAG: efflux RND transporter permease subunit, partial [Pseudomonadota bacterium]
MIQQFAEHRVAANLLMIMMILAGLWAVRTMPSMLDPPAHFPVVMVEVNWTGAAAEDMTSLVTTPIEQQLRTLTDLKELTSRTVNGHTSVTAIFHFDADMSEALDRAKQRVASIRNLPAGIEPPVVRRPLDTEPVSVLLLTGPVTLSELIPLARQFEKELLQRGIEGIRYDGLPEEEIAVLVDGQQLQSISLTLEALATEVGRSSQNVPAGAVGRGQASHQLRSLDQRRDAHAFAQLPIESNGQIIRLGDFADIVRRPRQGQPELRADGHPAIEMQLWRSTNTDAARADQVVQNWLAATRPNLPAGVEIREIANIWRMLDAQLDMILKNAVSGLLLVIGVLYLFLGGRASWWVTVGIPVSFLLGLCLFHVVFGYGISIIALIGFIMALGIVVDDAIVVGEDIVSHYEQGADPRQAAVAGAQRMWVPVMTSSLTTMAAFLPLLIIGGMLGDMVLALPTVLLCVIAASLVECFLVLPGHLRHSLERAQLAAPSTNPSRHQPAVWRHRFEARFNTFREHTFTPWVERALRYPGTTLLVTLCAMLVALSLVVAQHVGINLVTGFDFEALEANVEFSSSASTQDKADFINHLQDTLQSTHEQHNNDNVLGWVAKLNRADFSNERADGEQYAAVHAQYAFEEDRSISPQAFVRDWQAHIQRPAYVEQLTVAVSGGANNGNPDITLVLRGYNTAQLKAGTQALAELLASYPGVSNVTDNLPYGREQIIFQITPRGRSLGLTADSIGRQ